MPPACLLVSICKLTLGFFGYPKTFSEYSIQGPEENSHRNNGDGLEVI